MSYTFYVTKTDEGIKLEDVYPESLKHIPNGRFMLSGHTPSEDTSDYAGLAVNLYDEKHNLLGHAAAGYRVTKNAPTT